MKTLEMEIALASFMNIRTNLIVPNISWGMGIHECDLFILTPAGYATEIEIKISLQDLKKDLEKEHKHFHRKIKKLYFAIPEKLLKYKEYIPEIAGIIVVYKNINDYYNCKIVRKAKIKSNYKFREDERYDLARLGALRIWGLKRKLNKYIRSK